MRKSIALLLCTMSLILIGCSGKMNKPSVEIQADNTFMSAAITEALDGIYNGDGGPFGCVIVKDGKIVGKGHNRVLCDTDSTAHGEISAILNTEKNWALLTLAAVNCLPQENRVQCVYMPFFGPI